MFRLPVVVHILEHVYEALRASHEVVDHLLRSLRDLPSLRIKHRVEAGILARHTVAPHRLVVVRNAAKQVVPQADGLRLGLDAHTFLEEQQ